MSLPLLFCLGLSGLTATWACRRFPDSPGNRAVCFALLFLFLYSCQLFVDGPLAYGHDIQYHLLRIEGLVAAMGQGQFPVRIQPEWYNGYGYAASVFYPDLLLYPFALLRLCHLPLYVVYTLYLCVTTACTIALGRFCFSRIFPDRTLATVATCLLLLAPYRLTCVHVRAAVGEYTAMAFYPLLALALWRLNDEHNRPQPLDIRSGWLLLCLAMSGLLSCHILSVVKTSLLLCAALPLIFQRRLLRPALLLDICKAAGGTILLSLWFLLPLVDLLPDIIGAHPDPDFVQKHGSLLMQIFNPFIPGGGQSVEAQLGPVGEMPLAIGVLGLALPLYAAVRFVFGVSSRRQRNLLDLLALLTVICLLLSSHWFPFHRLAQQLPLISSAFCIVQFPWRYLGDASLLATLLMVASLAALHSRITPATRNSVIGALLLLLFLSSSWFYYAFSTTAQWLQWEDMPPERSGYDFMLEYMPKGASMNLKDTTLHHQKGIKVSAFQRHNGVATVTARNTRSVERALYLPLTWYKGMTATDLATGRRLHAGATNEKNVWIALPAGWQGKVEMRFHEPLPWRLAELISLLFALFFLPFAWRRLTGDRQNRRPPWL